MRDQERFAQPADVGATFESWRVFQILAEFIEGFERLTDIVPSVGMFGSSRMSSHSPYYVLGMDIAERLSNSGLSVISGGGLGLMEAFNKGAFAGKSASVGLNIFPSQEQPANRYQDISLYFRYSFSRKVVFVKNAAAYVVLPGGFGTLDELTEILRLIQAEENRQVPIILVGTEFWRGLADWIRDTLLQAGTVDSEDLNLFTIVDQPQGVVDAIFGYYESSGVSLIADGVSRGVDNLGLL